MAMLPASLKDRIEKLAQYVAQSNGAMEDTVRERQRTNPDFGFLFGGEGASYYTECVRHYSQAQAQAAHAQAAPATLVGGGYGGGGGGSGGGYAGGVGAPSSCGVPGAAPRNGVYAYASAADHSSSAAGHGMPPYLGAYRRADYSASAPIAPPAQPPHAPLHDESRIFELLERRDECRRRKDWVGADRLKDELGAVHNVVVNDRERSWSIRQGADAGGAPPPPYSYAPPSAPYGGGHAPPGPPEPLHAPSHSAPGASTMHDYRRAASDRHPVDTARVDALIAARMHAKITRDFDRADQLRAELRDLGVEVHDRNKEWFVDRPELAARTTARMPHGPPPSQQQQQQHHYPALSPHHAPPPYGHGAPPSAGPSAHGYTRDPADAIHLPNEAHIHALLAERLEAKKSRDFDKADRMREVLRSAGVEVYDREKRWRALPPANGMGVPPPAHHHAHHQQPPPPHAMPPAPTGGSQYYRRQHDDHKPVDIRAVEALLDERSHCKMQRNFARADQIRDALRQQHNVEVHDNERTWHVSRASSSSGHPPPPHVPPPANAARVAGGAEVRRDDRKGGAERSRSRSRSPDAPPAESSAAAE